MNKKRRWCNRILLPVGFFLAILIFICTLSNGFSTAEQGKAANTVRQKKPRHLVPRSRFLKDYGMTSSLKGLDDKSLYEMPGTMGKRDPLEDVAEEIRVKIDPTLDGKRYKDHFIKYIEKIRGEYQEFWKRIPLESRRYVDLDNDGVREYFVISNGMKPNSWEGFFDFFAVLKKKKVNRQASDKWEMVLFHKFDQNPHIDCDKCGFFEFELAVTDLDKDGRPDIVFTTMLLGGSGNTRFLHVISMHPDQGFRHYELRSREKVKIIDKNTSHPVFVQYDDDDWGPDDCHASVLSRGYQEKFFRWSPRDGFVPTSH